MEKFQKKDVICQKNSIIIETLWDIIKEVGFNLETHENFKNIVL